MAHGGPRSTVYVKFVEQNGSGQKGLAVLTRMGDQTQVVLYATSDISQVTHIHQGDCTHLGGVNHPLTSMATGVSVTMVEAAIDTLTIGGQAINLHMAGDPSIYKACGEIPEISDMPDEDNGDIEALLTFEGDIASFQLPELTMPVSSTIVWTNRDGAPLTATLGTNGLFDGEGWDSPTLSTRQSFSHTFDQTGAFLYTCTVHPSMNSTITVMES